VQIDNAPVACAQAQLWLGQRGGALVPRDFAYMTVSDGVGVGVVVGGQVLRGHGFTAGEFGHVPLDLDGPLVPVRRARLPRGVHVQPRHAVALPRPGALAVAHARPPAGDRADDRRRARPRPRRRRPRRGGRRRDGALPRRRHRDGGQRAQPGADLRRRRDHGGVGRVEPAVPAALAERALTEEAAATPIVAEPPEALPRLRGAAALVAAPMFAAPQVA
jgi:hypothetical protein